MGRGDNPNIEDKLRSAQRVLDGLSIISPVSEEASELEACINEQFESLIGSVLDFEGKLRASVGSADYQTALNTVGRFLLAFAARPGGKERLNLFTTYGTPMLSEYSPEECRSVRAVKYVDLRSVGTDGGTSPAQIHFDKSNGI